MYASGIARIFLADSPGKWLAVPILLTCGAIVVAVSAELGIAVVAVLASLSMSLSVSLGVAKTSTACGLNSLGVASGPNLSRWGRALAAIEFAATAAVIAAALGCVLSLFGTAVGGALLWPIAIPLFGYLGLRELGYYGKQRPISLHWQVPHEWVRDQRVAPFTWGILLGTGLTTWMPYSSYFGVLLLSLLLPLPYAATVMGAYGLSRALPVLATSFRPELLPTWSAHAWTIRLLGHVLAGGLCIVLAGAIGAALVLGIAPSLWRSN